MLPMHQKHLDHDKLSATDVLKTSSKRVLQKAVEAIGDLIGEIIANRIKKVSKNQQNNLETVTNEHGKEIIKELYVSPEEIQEIIYELKLIIIT